MPRVSVIIPVYNCEPFLRECVDSALGQTLRDIEVILVDDGSPDGSGEISDEYASKDSRVVVIHKENGGQSSARNAGLDAAGGEFVYFLDSDDIMDPTLLEKAVPGLDTGYDMVAFGFKTMFQDGRAVYKERRLTSSLKEVRIGSDEERYAFLTGPFRMMAIRWEVWNRVYRMDIIRRWNVRFPGKGVYPEDMYFNLCYVAHSSRILLLPDVLYTYRKRLGSISRDIYNTSKNIMFSTSNLLAESLRDYYESCEDCRYLSERFSPLYYLLHKAAIRRLRRFQWRQGLGIQSAKELLRENVKDYPSFIRTMTGTYSSQVVRESFRKDRRPLVQLTARLYSAELLDISRPWLRRMTGKATLSLIRFIFRLRLLV